MAHGNVVMPVLVIGDRSREARAVGHRLDRAPLRVTTAPLGADGTLPVALAADSIVVLTMPTDTTPAWDVVAGLHREPSRPLVVVMTPEPDDPVVDLCLLAGARTVLDANDPDTALIAAVERLARGGGPEARISYRRRRALQRLVTSGAPPAERAGVRLSALEPRRSAAASTSNDRLLDDLGPAQTAIVRGILEGATVQEIATARGVSATAMYAARQRLAGRLGVHPEQVDAEVVRQFGTSQSRPR